MENGFGQIQLIRYDSLPVTVPGPKIHRSSQISAWIVAPFKKPERDIPENEVFNNHVSIIRIRSEHAIGFLKGRFHSLKGLRVSIINEETHKVATYWIAACIGVHAFAMQCEARERAERGEDEGVDSHPFITQGLESGSDCERLAPQVTGTRTRLQHGKALRQELKEKLLASKERRQERRRQERQDRYF